MNLNYNEIIIFVIALLIGAAMPFVVQYFKLGKIEFEKLTAKYPLVYDSIMKIITSGVMDAELKWIEGQVEDKEKYAVEFIEKELAKYGLAELVDTQYIIDQIKIIVFKEFNKDKGKTISVSTVSDERLNRILGNIK